MQRRLGVYLCWKPGAMFDPGPADQLLKIRQRCPELAWISSDTTPELIRHSRTAHLSAANGYSLNLPCGTAIQLAN